MLVPYQGTWEVYDWIAFIDDSEEGSVSSVSSGEVEIDEVVDKVSVSSTHRTSRNDFNSLRTFRASIEIIQ